MPTRQELKDLAHLRLKEAEALMIAGHYEGAAYLCGYSVELALKARICKLLDLEEYPDTGKLRSVFAIHNLEQLLILSGLQAKLYREGALLASWSTATKWRPESRYNPRGTTTPQEVLEVLDAIRDPRKGVLQWIRKHW